MRKDILEKLDPLVNSFINGLIKINDDTESAKINFENETVNYQKLQEQLKAERLEDNKTLESMKDKLAEERAEQVRLNMEINDEISKYNKLSKDLESKSFATEQNLKSANVEREMISQSLERARAKETSLDEKMESLKRDSEDLARREEAIKEKEKNLSLKDAVLQHSEDEHIQKAKDFNDADLRLKAREKEVQRLINRYELEQLIKEGT